MADVKRINYFDGLLIKEDDFNLEQDYHIRLRRLHNRHFHKPGIIEGLVLCYDPVTKTATVTPGMALDQNIVEYADGSREENSREIILAAEVPYDLSSYKDTVYFYISYDETTTDKDSDKGGDKDIHWVEKAIIGLYTTKQTQAEYVFLGTVNVTNGTVDTTGRPMAGFCGKAGEVDSLTVNDTLIMGIAEQNSNLPTISGKTVSGKNGVEIDGSLTVIGDLAVQGTSTIINTQTLEVEDNIITLNKYQNGDPALTPPNTSGVEVYRGADQKKAQLIWDETNYQWQIGTEDKKPLVVNSGGLTVNGLLTASAGNAQTNGIAFTDDPGGGASDLAWIRYYNRSGENCVLEIGVSNDAQDHIALMPSGNVGIGTIEPQAQLQVTKQISVGPFASPNNHEGALETCGTSAGISFFKRTLSTYPPSLSAGDRYQWYNSDGTACLWTDSGGDIFKVDSTCNVTVGRTDKTGTLTINGPTSGNALSVTGSTNISSSLTVGSSTIPGMLTVNGRIGIGTTNINKALLEVGEGGTVYTTAIFGKNQGIALVAHDPNLAFNSYYDTDWKTLSDGYSGVIGVYPDKGGMKFYTSTSSNKAGVKPDWEARLTIFSNGTVAVTGNNLTVNSKYVPVGTDEKLMIIRGTVFVKDIDNDDDLGAPNIDTTSGSGYTATQVSVYDSDSKKTKYKAGQFIIKFDDKSFQSEPTVVASQYYDDPSQNTRDNAIVGCITTSSCNINVGDSDGKKCDRHFTFIAIGPRYC